MPKCVHQARVAGGVQEALGGSAYCHAFFLLGFRPWQAGEARSPDGTREISRNEGSELPNATIAPEGDVVADATRCEGKLMLIPRNAAGTATPVGIPVCYCSTRKTEG